MMRRTLHFTINNSEVSPCYTKAASRSATSNMQLVDFHANGLQLLCKQLPIGRAGQTTCTDAYDDGDAAQQDCADAQQPFQMHAASHLTGCQGCQQTTQMPADAAPIGRARQEHAQHERRRLQLMHTGACSTSDRA
jgi:hypothetical protein